MRNGLLLHRVPLCGALCMVFSVSLPHATAAQETGALQGTVEDSITGRPLAGVQIAVQGTGFETRTVRDGSYRIDEVPAGTVPLCTSSARMLPTPPATMIGL